ncbi:uncharacterized protein LOC129592987 [Paramacrobiotus metropolitanus]|uniref:uncharacterized protein LOC129592987 n=1 Tax=Paramacrobiotus metropolitanus TaxID=2943436 RepID=UPI002445EDBF|nr:uncharacterized protein LOC129592987 [Paramacrobiotus metropolitanus]
MPTEWTIILISSLAVPLTTAGISWGTTFSAVNGIINGGSLMQKTIADLQTFGDMDCWRNVVIVIQNHFAPPSTCEVYPCIDLAPNVTDLSLAMTRAIRQRSLHYEDFYAYYGRNRIIPQPTIRPGQQEACGFSKYWHRAEGTSGVLRYRFDGYGRAVCIYIAWGVIWHSGSNRYGIMLTQADSGGSCESDRSLKDTFKDCFSYRDGSGGPRSCHWSKRVRRADAGGRIDVSGYGLQVLATMGNNEREVFKVEVWPN